MKKRVLVSLILVLLCSALLFTGCFRPMTWQEQYDLGVRYLNDGKYEEAILAFTAAIELDPQRPEAYASRAEAYVLTGNEIAARKDADKVIQLDPSFSWDDYPWVKPILPPAEPEEDTLPPTEAPDADPTEAPATEATQPTEATDPTEVTEATEVTQAPDQGPDLSNLKKDSGTIQALSAVLYDLSFSPDYFGTDVSKWNDMAVGGAIYTKLRQSYDEGPSCFLQKEGVIPTSTMEYDAFDRKAVEKMTWDLLGRKLPTDSYYLEVTQDEVRIQIAHGEYREYIVDGYIEDGSNVIVIGTVTQYFSMEQDRFMAVMRKNPDSMFGYTLLSLGRYEAGRKNTYLTAKASSELEDGGTVYYAENVLDGDLSTAWVEGVSGVGKNQWIELSAPNGDTMELTKIEFALGYQKSQHLLGRNGWPVRVRIECDGGYSQEVSFSDYNETIQLTRTVKTNWVRITILDAEAGTHYDDICISDIRLLGKDGKAY